MITFTTEYHNHPVQSIALSPDEKTFASISVSPDKITTMYVCDSETGHRISDPFKFKSLSDGRFGLAGRFSPDGKHILVKFLSKTLSCHAVVWDIERGQKEFSLEGFDFVFTHCGHNEHRIASVEWVDEDRSSPRTTTSIDLKHKYGPSIWTIASTESEDHDPRSTHILIKSWDISHGISDILFEVTGITVAQFSPDGQYLAVERQSENAIELWNLEDGKMTHRFSHSHYPGNLSSLYFSPTSDCLMAGFRESDHYCLWGLDTQAMVSFDLDVGQIPPVVFHSPHANHVFVPQGNTVEIWEVSMTGPNMIFETEPLTNLWIGSICPLRDGLRFLVGSSDKTVRMWNMEDLAGNHPVTRDMDVPIIIAFSRSGKMAATKSQQGYVKLRDTTTWKPRDVECKGSAEIVFSAEDNQMTVLTDSLVTIYDVNHPESCLSFDPWPKDIGDRKVAFQTHNDLVICAKLKGDDSGLLQVWKLKDHSECTFSLNISLTRCSSILLAPDGMTVIFTDPVLCYSWDHANARFNCIHFADQVHLGPLMAYSPDGKLFACRSLADDNVRVWDTRTGQLCGKPITMPHVHKIALSPALNDRSLGDRLIALRCSDSNTIALFDAYTGHWYAQCLDPGSDMAFIRDGTKLVSCDPIRVHDIVGLTAKHQNATCGYEPREMRDGWVVGQTNELLFWVPHEHRKVLCLSHVEMIWSRPTKVDLSRFRYGSKWIECIDQEWLKESTDLSQVQNSATMTSPSQTRTPEISQAQTSNYPPHVYQPHPYYSPIPTMTALTAPYGFAPYHGYVQSPRLAIYPPNPSYPSGQSMPAQYIYPGYPPPAPIPQMSSAARDSSPSRSPAVVPFMAIPDSSQAQTSATATSPSPTQSPGILQTQTQVSYYPPHVHQPHLYHPPPPHEPFAPGIFPPIYAGYPPPSPLSAPSLGNSTPNCMGTLWSLSSTSPSSTTPLLPRRVSP